MYHDAKQEVAELLPRAEDAERLAKAAVELKKQARGCATTIPEIHFLCVEVAYADVSTPSVYLLNGYLSRLQLATIAITSLLDLYICSSEGLHVVVVHPLSVVVSVAGTRELPADRGPQ